MYQKEASDEELASWGFTKDDVAVTVEIWPENFTAFNVFNALATQWRYSMNGITGLDYNVVPMVLRTLNIARSEWNQVFDDIRVMENAALKEVNKK